MPRGFDCSSYDAVMLRKREQSAFRRGNTIHPHSTLLPNYPYPTLSLLTLLNNKHRIQVLASVYKRESYRVGGKENSRIAIHNTVPNTRGELLITPLLSDAR